ncbi:MAG: heparinase [Lachnospiraceae bacterium]|nr:heparinase [Lachnospiraceae bacterium]
MTKADFFDRENECYYFDDPDAIADFCRENWPEDVSHILRIADEVIRNEFLFDLKWDMERTYEPVIFDKEIVWDYKPGNDPEFIYQFNRHRFFICLGQAYALTKDEKYAKKFFELLMHWIKNMPLCNQNKWSCWRTIEAGLRGEYWSKAFRYFKDSPHMTDEIVDAFYQSLTVHANYLIESHSPFRLMSNWGVLENHGLFNIAMTFPQSEQTKEYAKIALDHMATEARLQIMSDGVQWEQSPMYHNEVLHCYMDVLILAKRNHIPIPAVIYEKVHKMALVNIAWSKPDHHQFMNGDSDDTDVRDMITKAAYLFDDPVLKKHGFKVLDFETVWDLGIGAEYEYEEMEEEESENISFALMDSGNYYLRSNWSETGNLLHFQCGTLGAGHGHSDKLHIDLVINGEDVLMDAGRYNYVAGPERYEFKDPTAHNTLTVDDRLFTVCKDSWECSKLSQPVNQKHTFTDEYEFVQGGHLGYMDLENGVFVNRKIIYIKPDVYIIMDELYTGGSHKYEQYFHFNSQGEVTVNGKKVTYHGKTQETELYFLSDGVNLQKKQTRLSRNYNQAEQNETVVARLKKKGFASMFTVIYGKKKESMDEILVEKVPVKSNFKQNYHPDEWAEAVEISVHGKQYVAIICHQEVNTPTDQTEASSCLGFGNVIVFNKARETEVGEVLLY